ncbi:hypothetical protein K353_02738 [Kitasatospora sp. SolWspMP-SS2h]|uniref:hypothetical protein n=1 Tax=Kitasatospora sp. SolWspMP-SS2h TaxID=1305729 RepID=UPI000DB938E1|nr:hypothetical protein [Kitasatospora sp. SolWspMP-SS2h]RAJ42385.1 hypothetical protein K353_02738 [Kitasatospora sp. SolWspMP-SS2h]
MRGQTSPNSPVAAAVTKASLAVERAATGRYLVQLGGVTPDVASELATLIWTGAPYVRAVRGGELTGVVSMLWSPERGELLVDAATGRLGEFSHADERGDLVLVPADGGEPWSVGRCAVRHPTRADLAQADPAHPAPTPN